MDKPKIIVVLGPTATGKSDLAVLIAKKYKGEVISADSRQVYKGLDIGTGKITKKEMLGVKHHLLDVANPKKRYSVSDWQKEANKKIKDILKRKKIPIICGGTGFYIQSIVENISLPDVKPDSKLREKLEKKSTHDLFLMLKKIDPERIKTIDTKNKVRLIRAVEIAKKLGEVPKIKTGENQYEILQIGLVVPEKELKDKIKIRLIKRLKKGMLSEVKRVKKTGVSWQRLYDLGLEYRYTSLHLKGQMSKQDMINNLEKEIWHYAKRQMTWFKRDKKIKWFNPKDSKKIEKEVSKFLALQKI